MGREIDQRLGLIRKITTHGTAKFDLYTRIIGESGLCPYIPSAVQKELLLAVEKNLTDVALEELEASIFYYGLLATEQFRRKRLELTASERELLCINVIYQLPSMHQHQAEPLFKTPHWLLRCFYASVNVMFGKFWIGERGVSLHGKAIPTPPCNFLAIRSAIMRRDPEFLRREPTTQESITEALIESTQSVDMNIRLFNERNLPDPIIVPDQSSITEFYQKFQIWAARHYPLS